MAKRSVKRTRERQRTAPRETSRRPARHDRSFWLGVLAAAALLIPVAVLAVVITANRGDESPESVAGSQESFEAQVAKLKRKSIERDKRQVKELTARMATMIGELGPTLRGLAKTVPPEQKHIGPLSSARAVDRWNRTLQKAGEYFEDPPSGETQTNEARMGFTAAIAALTGAVGTYRLALTNSSQRRPLLQQVRAERDLAIQIWFLGGTALDAVNHKYGYGHHHLFLAPEGSGPPGDLQTG